jgi:AcrR family transcriptional regulator
MRRDALINRERVLAAADAMFREHGLEVSVGEIADAAGVGRGTLFRNFPNKEALIAAVAVQRFDDALRAGNEMLANEHDDAEVVFTFIGYMTARQEEDRALLQAVTDDVLMSDPAMGDVHRAMLELLEELLERGKRAGSVRPEATAADLLMLLKGLCLRPAAELPLAPATILRHLDLVRAALSTPEYSRPLRGEPATMPV